MTALLLVVILGATDIAAPVGLALALIHLVSIPVIIAPVNPARSIGPALFAAGAFALLWLLIVAPCIGAVAYTALRPRTPAERRSRCGPPRRRWRPSRTSASKAPWPTRRCRPGALNGAGRPALRPSGPGVSSGR